MSIVRLTPMIAAPVAALTPVLPGKGDRIVVVGLRRLGDGWFHHTGRSPWRRPATREQMARPRSRVRSGELTAAVTSVTLYRAR